MNIKCKACGTVRHIDFSICTTCHARQGYLQEPKVVTQDDRNFHLENKIKHTASGNIYQIKEFQKSGMIAKLITGIKELTGKDVYISYSNLNEYKEA